MLFVFRTIWRIKILTKSISSTNFSVLEKGNKVQENQTKEMWIEEFYELDPENE